ncbi:hypothetical protein IQ64_03745 [Streptomyces stelliscabiei]|nr:hypothetical protein IQ64_03745 [Streptomyces stelliscabiei]
MPWANTDSSVALRRRYGHPIASVSDQQGRPRAALTYERVQNRLALRRGGAARAEDEWPAHLAAFDLPRLDMAPNQALDSSAVHGRGGTDFSDHFVAGPLHPRGVDVTA